MDFGPWQLLVNWAPAGPVRPWSRSQRLSPPPGVVTSHAVTGIPPGDSYSAGRAWEEPTAMDYRKPLDASDDNETAARDCETVCVCNLKAPHGTARVLAACRTVGVWVPPAFDVWSACDCRACRRDDVPGSLAWLDAHAGESS